MCCFYNIKKKISDKTLRAVIHNYLGFVKDLWKFYAFQTNFFADHLHKLVQQDQLIETTC